MKKRIKSVSVVLSVCLLLMTFLPVVALAAVPPTCSHPWDSRVTVTTYPSTTRNVGSDSTCYVRIDHKLTHCPCGTYIDVHQEFPVSSHSFTIVKYSYGSFKVCSTCGFSCAYNEPGIVSIELQGH